MRTSFEEMKKFIAQQDGLVIDASEKQHERTQNVVGGPRPLPTRVERTVRQRGPADHDEWRAKRRNIFKRALKGLTLRSSSDLNKIEDMLEQILEDVEGIRAGQVEERSNVSDNRGATSRGIEAGGSSYTPMSPPTASQPSYQPSYPPNPLRQAPAVSRGGIGASGGAWVPGQPANHMNPVNEEDEDLYLNGSPVPQSRELAPPLDTPQAMPRSVDRASRHKSNNSGSIIPKISRWSKTTAWSMGDNIRNSMQSGGGRSQPPNTFYYPSPSHHDLAQYQHRMEAYHDHDDEQEEAEEENRPPSPLVPSQVSEAPKYQAHRNSLNLEHPQPRQGSSGQYQRQLESQAYNLGSPVSQQSERYGGDRGVGGGGSNASPASNHYQQILNRGRLSPMSDGGFSDTSAKTPPPTRPPKLRDSGPLVPEQRSEGKGSKYADRITSRVCEN